MFDSSRSGCDLWANGISSRLAQHARLVGYVLKLLFTKHTVSWHRVINAQGKISLSKLNAQGKNIQTLKLQAEGIVVISEKVNFKQYQWQN